LTARRPVAVSRDYRFFRFAVSATVAYSALDVAYDGLPTVIYMNMLDANVLLSAITQPSQNL
jgi:hypothetical protein